MRTLRTLALSLAATIAPASAGWAETGTAAQQAQVITLGTMAGPMANPQRSQPATLLKWDGGMVLVDVGDGTLEQMGKAGITAVPLRSIIITHTHADHMGGLYALLARRYQLMDPPVTIYGPPGTKAMVDGLVAALAPLKITSPALPGMPLRDPADGVKVVEIGDGADLTIEGVRVRAVANTHYLSGSAAPDPATAQSLSLRFELPGRSIVLTGDSGPSERLVGLAQGADLLVASILDLDGAVATIRASRPNAPEPFFAAARAHFAEHHLSPQTAGQLAQAASVKSVLFTHIGITPARMDAARSEVEQAWKGPITFADDLGRY